MTSNHAAYWLAKVFGSASVLWLSYLGARWLDQPHLFGAEMNFATAISVLAALAVGYAGIFRFGVIECSDNRIEIRRNGEMERAEWGEVEELLKIPFTTPPVYRFSFTNGLKPVYFMMSLETRLSVGLYSWDFSGFEEYARARMARNLRPTPPDTN